MAQNIILTTGIYDLIKDHIRRKKVTPAEEEILKLELKNAKQVTRVNLPEDVVSINSRVTIKDLDTNQEEVYVFVAPDKAKQRNNTKSILTEMGLALVGYQEGDLINWPFKNEPKQIEILKVERLA
jgi:regulator of nucleoside diphosphate kinase